MIVPISVSALSPSTPPGGGITGLDVILANVAKLVWQLFAGIAIIMFVVAGILFLTSAGDPGKVATARQAVIWGVIGIIVAILAFSILQIVGSAVGV